MADLGFAFNNLDSSDMVLRIEIVSGKDYGWLKSLAKRSQIPHLLAVVYDFESASRSVRVVTLNINSRILASESLYFKRLFKYAKKESDKKEATLKINPSEEAALMDLLNFMYINNLSATKPRYLEEVRMMAEKLEVPSCIEYVKKLSMSLQHELYTGEPSCASMAEEVKPLKDAAKEYLIERHKDLSGSWTEASCLPLSAIEIVLGSPGLVVDSEDSVYDFIVACCRRHQRFPKRLFRFVYFPYLTMYPLEMWGCFLHEMSINHGFPYGGRPLRIQRVYRLHPIKVVHRFESPLPRSVVYFNLTMQDLENLNSRKRFSQSFPLGAKGSLWLFLVAQHDRSGSLSLFISSFKGLPTFKIDYELAVLMKEEYKICFKANNIALRNTDDDYQYGVVNLLGMPWADLMAKDSDHFVDGVLNFRFDITLNKQ